MIRAPRFWLQPKPSALARMLQPIGALYGRATLSRMNRPGHLADVPVICIGNPVVGGAGKTPTAIAIAEILVGLGRRPAFLTRGYGGSLAGPVAVDPTRHTAEEIGDEPLLLAAHAPAIVARDRAAGADFAWAGGADVVVMDDGFQNPALAKDLALLVVDGGAGDGNGLVFPAGPLRAPLGRQIERAHGIVVIGPGEAGTAIARAATAQGLPVHRAEVVPVAQSAARFSGRRVLAYAGIGRPEKFVKSLAEAGAEVVKLHAFPDHHPISDTQARALIEEAGRLGALPATTAKDRARLAGSTGARAELVSRSLVLDIEIVFADRQALTEQIRAALTGWEAGRAP